MAFKDLKMQCIANTGEVVVSPSTISLRCWIHLSYEQYVIKGLVLKCDCICFMPNLLLLANMLLHIYVDKPVIILSDYTVLLAILMRILAIILKQGRAHKHKS